MRRALGLSVLVAVAAGCGTNWVSEFRVAGYPGPGLSIETEEGRDVARDAAYAQAQNLLTKVIRGSTFTIRGEDAEIHIEGVVAREILEDRTYEGMCENGWYLEIPFEPMWDGNAVGETTLDDAEYAACLDQARPLLAAEGDAIKRYLTKAEGEGVWKEERYSGTIYLVGVERYEEGNENPVFRANFYVDLE